MELHSRNSGFGRRNDGINHRKAGDPKIPSLAKPGKGVKNVL